MRSLRSTSSMAWSRPIRRCHSPRSSARWSAYTRSARDCIRSPWTSVPFGSGSGSCSRCQPCNACTRRSRWFRFAHDGHLLSNVAPHRRNTGVAGPSPSTGTNGMGRRHQSSLSSTSRSSPAARGCDNRCACVVNGGAATNSGIGGRSPNRPTPGVPVPAVTSPAPSASRTAATPTRPNQNQRQQRQPAKHTEEGIARQPNPIGSDPAHRLSTNRRQQRQAHAHPGRSAIQRERRKKITHRIPDFRNPSPGQPISPAGRRPRHTTRPTQLVN